jgi:transcriptional regulator with XRE-family HTH domain
MARAASVKKLPRLASPEEADGLPAQFRRPAAEGDGKLALGSKLRRIRLERGMTLEEVGQKSGVARSTLSKVENGLMSPTITMLQRIIDGLSLGFDELFEGGVGKEQVVGRRSITRAGKGQPFHVGPYAHEMMAADIAAKKMQVFKTRILARTVAEFDGWVRHDGEEFIYVLDGQIKVFTEFYTEETLGVGDGIYLDSQMGHACVSTSREDAEVLWVSTGRSFGLSWDERRS